MEYITEKDDKWHPMNKEMPPHTTDVELKDKDGIITKAEIVVEMSGYYLYKNPGWGDLSDYTHWRFLKKEQKRIKMTREEAIKILQNLYFEVPEIKEALQIAIETLSRPSLPSNIDEVAHEFEDKAMNDYDDIVVTEDGVEVPRLKYGFADVFKAAAEWMAEQGYSQEEIVEDKSIELGYGVLPGISPIINLPDSFKPGDKVIVQVRKKQ